MFFPCIMQTKPASVALCERESSDCQQGLVGTVGSISKRECSFDAGHAESFKHFSGWTTEIRRSLSFRFENNVNLNPHSVGSKTSASKKPSRNSRRPIVKIDLNEDFSEAKLGKVTVSWGKRNSTAGVGCLVSFKFWARSAFGCSGLFQRESALLL